MPSRVFEHLKEHLHNLLYLLHLFSTHLLPGFTPLLSTPTKILTNCVCKGYNVGYFSGQFFRIFEKKFFFALLLLYLT